MGMNAASWQRGLGAVSCQGLKQKELAKKKRKVVAAAEVRCDPYE